MFTHFTNMTDALKKAVSTFFLSIVSPEKFFLTEKYAHRKTDAGACLLMAFLAYFICIVAAPYFNSDPGKMNGIVVSVLTSGIKAVVFILPLFIFFTALIGLFSKGYAKNFVFDTKEIGITMLANALFIESSIYFVYLLLCGLSHYLSITTAVQTYYQLFFRPVSHLFGSNYLSDYLIAAVLLQMYIRLSFVQKILLSYKTIIMFTICMFGVTITNLVYVGELMIVSSEFFHETAYRPGGFPIPSLLHPLVNSNEEALINKDPENQLKTLCTYYKENKDSIYLNNDIWISNPFAKKIYIDTAGFLTFRYYQLDSSFATHKDLIELSFTKQCSAHNNICVEPGKGLILHGYTAIKKGSLPNDQNLHQLLDKTVGASVSYSFIDTGFIRQNIQQPVVVNFHKLL